MSSYYFKSPEFLRLILFLIPAIFLVWMFPPKVALVLGIISALFGSVIYSVYFNRFSHTTNIGERFGISMMWMGIFSVTFGAIKWAFQ